jgi:hypothetical protein
VNPSGGPELQYVIALDSTSTQTPMTGELVLYTDPADTTKYKAKFKPQFASSYTDLITSASATTASFAADTTWRHYSATTKNAFTVLARHWSASTAAVGKEWSIGLIADQQPGDSIEGSEDRFFIAPSQGPANYFASTPAPDRTASMPGHYRKLSAARFEQLRADSYVATVAGLPRTHLPLRYHENWAEGMTLTVFSADGARWHHAEIHSVISTGGDIDTVVLTEELLDEDSNEEVYDTTSSVCSGVMAYSGLGESMGRLSTADRTRIVTSPTTATTAIGATSFQVESGMVATAGSVHLYQQTTGTREVRTFTRSGTILTIPAGATLTHAYSDPVVFVSSTWHAVWFTQLRPELTASATEQKALPRLMRWVPR